jgi:TP901 family phage tail tape measure protein
MGTIRTVLAVDGESKFRASMKEVNSTLKAMQASVKALSTEYVTNSDKVKNLQKQNEQLREIESQQMEKLKLLTSAVSRSGTAYEEAKQHLLDVVAAHGTESKEADKARKAVSSAAVTYNNYRTQLAQTETALNETRNQIHQNTQEIDTQINHSKPWIQQLESIKNNLEKVGKAAMQVAKTEFAALQTSVKAVSAEFEIAFKGLGMYTEAIGKASLAAAKFATGVGTSFESGMSTVQAILGIFDDTEGVMSELEAKAKQVGSTTKFTATQAAEAFKYMAMAGWDAEEMLAGIDGITQLAAASGEELGIVSDIVTDSLTALGMSASDTSKFVDILAQAATNSNTTVTKMGATFQYCAPIAGAMGYKIEDLAVAIGLMASSGIKADKAGTALRSLITNLAAPTENADKRLTQFGISLTDEYDNMKSFSQVVTELRNAFADLSEVEKAAAAKDISGKTGMAGLLAIVNSTPEDFDQLTAAIADSTGAAEKMSEVMLDNLAGSVTLAKSAIEGLGLSIFNTFSDDLRENVDNIQKWASEVSSIMDKGPEYSVANWVKGKFAGEFSDAVFAGAVDLMNAAPEVVDTFNALIIAGIDALKNSLLPTVWGLGQTLVDGFFDMLNDITDNLPDYVYNAVLSVKHIFEMMMTNMSSLAENLTEELPGIIDSLLRIFNGQFIGDIYNTGLDILLTLIEGITDNLDKILQNGMNVLIALLDGMLEAIPRLADIARDIIEQLTVSITDNIDKIITVSVDIILALVDTIIDNLDLLVEAALKIVIAVIRGIVNNLDKIVDKVPEILIAIFNAILDNLDIIVQAAYEIILALGYALVEGLDMLWGTVWRVPQEIQKIILDNDWKATGARILEGIADGLVNMGTYVHDKVKEAGTNLVDEFKSLFKIHSPSKLFHDEIGVNIAYGITGGTVEGLDDSSIQIDKAAQDYSNDIMQATKNAFVSANVSLDSAGTSGTTVQQNINFGDVTINNDMDIEEVSYKIADLARSYTLGGGG